MRRDNLLALLAAFLAGPLAVLLCPRAPACDRVRACTVAAAPYVAPAAAYVPAVATVSYVPYAVQVPTYSASYSAAPQLPPEVTLLLQQLVASSTEHGQRLNRLEAPSAGPGAQPYRQPAPAAPPPMPGPTDAIQPASDMPKLFTTCAKCHDATTAPSLGKGHVFFAAGQFTAACEVYMDIADTVSAGTMPPGSSGLAKPTPADVDEVFAYLRKHAHEVAGK